MRHSRLWLVASIIILVVLGGFLLSVPHTQEGKELALSAIDTSEQGSLVSIHDAFKKGKHTINGFVEVLNYCNTLSVDTQYVSIASSTEHISLELTLSEEPGICLQVPKRIEFSTTITAPENLPIEAFLNGVETAITFI